MTDPTPVPMTDPVPARRSRREQGSAPPAAGTPHCPRGPSTAPPPRRRRRRRRRPLLRLPPWPPAPRWHARRPAAAPAPAAQAAGRPAGNVWACAGGAGGGGRSVVVVSGLSTDWSPGAVRGQVESLTWCAGSRATASSRTPAPCSSPSVSLRFRSRTIACRLEAGWALPRVCTCTQAHAAQRGCEARRRVRRRAGGVSVVGFAFCTPHGERAARVAWCRLYGAQLVRGLSVPAAGVRREQVGRVEVEGD
jgi:hypothetical protein